MVCEPGTVKVFIVQVCVWPSLESVQARSEFEHLNNCIYSWTTRF